MSVCDTPQHGGRPVWATVADFVKLSGIGRTKVFELLGTRALIARKLGSRTLIEVESGLAYIEALPAWGSV